MIGFSIGPLSFTGTAGPPLLSAKAYLQPGPEWDGTAESGFASLPMDPVRNTGKPVLRLLVPPDQHFTDELTIGVIAAANDGGSLLDNLGMEKVVVHCEGARHEIEAPTLRASEDANGRLVSYLGWWTTLKRPRNRTGTAHLYFEGIPRDPSLQTRVIGPYRFTLTPIVHEYDLEVAPSLPAIAGKRFRSLGAALFHLAITQGDAQNPRIRITETGTYDFAGSTYARYEGSGYCTIEATVPVVIGFAAPQSGETLPRSSDQNITDYGSGAITSPLITATCCSSTRRPEIGNMCSTESGWRIQLAARACGAKAFAQSIR